MASLGSLSFVLLPFATSHAGQKGVPYTSGSLFRQMMASCLEGSAGVSRLLQSLMESLLFKQQMFGLAGASETCHIGLLTSF